MLFLCSWVWIMTHYLVLHHESTDRNPLSRDHCYESHWLHFFLFLLLKWKQILLCVIILVAIEFILAWKEATFPHPNSGKLFQITCRRSHNTYIFLKHEFWKGKRIENRSLKTQDNQNLWFLSHHLRQVPAWNRIRHKYSLPLSLR